jgi:hypothetical protein
MAEQGLFFSEEKKQKTFISLSRCFTAASAQETKVLIPQGGRRLLFE